MRRRRWLRRLLAALLPPLLALGCTEQPPVPMPPAAQTPIPDPPLAAAIDQAYAIWRAVGAEPPSLAIILSPTPWGSCGFCYCSAMGVQTDGQSDLIRVCLPLPNLIAHELGHAMGLHHVSGRGELMFPTVYSWSGIGPETYEELRRVQRGDPP